MPAVVPSPAPPGSGAGPSRRPRSARAARRALLRGALLPAAAGLLVVILLPQTALAGGASYVALGDSYTAGPLIPDQTGSPFGCLRSTSDYPADVATTIGASSYINVSCSGATTADMTQPQSVTLGTNPPQFGALSSGTTLVTVGIGGNNIGFYGIVKTCAEESLTNPFGSPCKSHYTAGGTDQLAQAIQSLAPKIGSMVQEIRALAPSARVFLVGYPVLLPNSGNGCWPLFPISFGDVPYLRGVELKLNAMLASEAAANGAGFVNTYADSIGHDACQAPGTKWVEGLIPTSPAAPFHPNQLGEEHMADQVIAAAG